MNNSNALNSIVDSVDTLGSGLDLFDDFSTEFKEYLTEDISNQVCTDNECGCDYGFFNCNCDNIN